MDTEKLDRLELALKHLRPLVFNSACADDSDGEALGDAQRGRAKCEGRLGIACVLRRAFSGI
jgi:hypothetical protein